MSSRVTKECVLDTSVYAILQKQLADTNTNPLQAFVNSAPSRKRKTNPTSLSPETNKNAEQKNDQTAHPQISPSAGVVEKKRKLDDTNEEAHNEASFSTLWDHSKTSYFATMVLNMSKSFKNLSSSKRYIDELPIEFLKLKTIIQSLREGVPIDNIIISKQEVLEFYLLLFRQFVHFRTFLKIQEMVLIHIPSGVKFDEGFKPMLQHNNWYSMYSASETQEAEVTSEMVKIKRMGMEMAGVCIKLVSKSFTGKENIKEEFLTIGDEVDTPLNQYCMIYKEINHYRRVIFETINGASDVWNIGKKLIQELCVKYVSDKFRAFPLIMCFFKYFLTIADHPHVSKLIAYKLDKDTKAFEDANATNIQRSNLDVYERFKKLSYIKWLSRLLAVGILWSQE